MKNNTLREVAAGLVSKGKGILAADESEGTCGKRFDKYGIAKTLETRRVWRELLFTTPEIESGLSGVILVDETIRQKAGDGRPFAELLAARGIAPGIKVDQKTEAFVGSPEEEVTKGLEGLRERLFEYAKMGAKFTKWRAVIRIGQGLPTKECIRENTKRMAEYAHVTQEAGLMPIVEPEVLLDGTHNMSRCEEVIRETLTETFSAILEIGARFDCLILKSSMVLPGKDSGEKATAKQIAEATVRALKASVPKEVAGIVFLSGGLTPVQATENLNEMAKIPNKPWPLTFSYSRALQEPVMKAWIGKDENVKAAQDIFRKRVLATAAASEGKWTPKIEL